MRSIWNGAISFGLVNIPVNLFTAEVKNDLKFSYIDSRDENKIKYKRVNEVTGDEVPWDQIVKAYEFEDGDYVVMTDEDFEKADTAAVKTVDIETFINRDELPLLYLEKPYYMSPMKGGEKPYVLLRNALNKSGKIAIARVVIRTKESLAAIYDRNDALILNLIRFYDDIRSMEDLNIPQSVKISDKEMELAQNLIDGMTGEWNPEEYKDEYRNAIMKRIKAKSKSKGKDLDDEEAEEAAPTDGKIVDIMSLLKKSVAAQPQRARASRQKKKAAEIKKAAQ